MSIVTRNSLVEAVADRYDTSRQQAKDWLRDTFVPEPDRGIGNWNRLALRRMSKKGSRTRAASSRV